MPELDVGATYTIAAVLRTIVDGRYGVDLVERPHLSRRCWPKFWLIKRDVYRIECFDYAALPECLTEILTRVPTKKEVEEVG